MNDRYAFVVLSQNNSDTRWYLVVRSTVLLNVPCFGRNLRKKLLQIIKLFKATNTNWFHTKPPRHPNLCGKVRYNTSYIRKAGIIFPYSSRQLKKEVHVIEKLLTRMEI